MYQDQDSIKVFERMHARDRVKDLARHIGESSDELDVFAGHSRAEESDGLINIVFSIVVGVLVVAAFFYFWK